MEWGSCVLGSPGVPLGQAETHLLDEELGAEKRDPPDTLTRSTYGRNVRLQPQLQMTQFPSFPAIVLWLRCLFSSSTEPQGWPRDCGTLGPT